MSYRACLGSITVNVISGTCSFWSICLVFLDNYLSVRRIGPADPGLSLTKARWCIVCGWVLVTIYSVVGMFFQAPPENIATNCSTSLLTDGSLLSLGVFILAVIVVTMFFMLMTLYTIKKRSDTLFQEGTHTQNVRRQQNLKMRSRVVRLFAIIAIGVIISWCPFCHCFVCISIM